MTPSHEARPRRREWSLSRESFDRLLACLDSDHERAGESYERIRRKLTKLFEWRGCVRPEELVDVAFDRVARRLEEGADIRASHLYTYFHGVALNVLREHWRGQATEPLPERPGPTRSAFERSPEPSVDADRRLTCLDECLDGLPAQIRRLLQRYHDGEKGARIRARKELAEALQITAGALRIRLYRIHADLEGCVEACEKRAAL
jgi:DNA-directed RNA polymerase specialized sigma24 family protein